jgi:hypothetical protein
VRCWVCQMGGPRRRGRSWVAIVVKLPTHSAQPTHSGQPGEWSGRGQGSAQPTVQRRRQASLTRPRNDRCSTAGWAGRPEGGARASAGVWAVRECGGECARACVGPRRVDREWCWSLVRRRCRPALTGCASCGVLGNMMADGGEAPMDRGRSFFFRTMGSAHEELTTGGIREPTAKHQLNGAKNGAPGGPHSGCGWQA